ncbi:MAG TPA: 30S ribosomal protein S6 [Actinomycetota bacterium]|nr:30S ribosomal protein S6 [Actinomycetota bacterium]
MRRYEVMLILPPDADDRAIGGVTDRIAQVLRERGGEVVRTDRWGKRRLAYEIKHLSEGFYLVVQFDAQPAAVKEVDRVLALADEVVRHKILVLPPGKEQEPERAAGAA